MVNIGQVERGIQRYIEAEFGGKSAGLSKWAIMAAAGIIAGAASRKLGALLSTPAVQGYGFTDESGGIDLDALYQRIREAANTPVTEEMPIIGAVTFTVTDVDRLYNLILSS